MDKQLSVGLTGLGLATTPTVLPQCLLGGFQNALNCLSPAKSTLASTSGIHWGTFPAAPERDSHRCRPCWDLQDPYTTSATPDASSLSKERGKQGKMFNYCPQLAQVNIPRTERSAWAAAGQKLPWPRGAHCQESAIPARVHFLLLQAQSTAAGPDRREETRVPLSQHPGIRRSEKLRELLHQKSQQ